MKLGPLGQDARFILAHAPPWAKMLKLTTQVQPSAVYVQIQLIRWQLR